MNVFDLYEQMIAEPIKQELPKGKPICCGQDMIDIDAYTTCVLCGNALDSLVFDVRTNDTGRIKTKVCYKRNSYFKQRLNQISCKRMCSNNQYNTVLALLKKPENHFDTLKELKAILKKNKKFKYYQWNFLLYKDVKGEELIKLTHKQIEEYNNWFQQFNHRFNKRNQKKAQMLSYAFIIHYLLKRDNIPNYDLVVVPATAPQLQKRFEKLISNNI